MNCQPECYVNSIALEGTSKTGKHETIHSNIHVMDINNVISVVYHLLTQSSMKSMRRHLTIHMFLEQAYSVIDAIIR